MVLLLFHVEADADAVVVLADFAELTGGLIAAEGSEGAQDGEEDLRLEEQGDASVFALGVAVDVEEPALQGELGVFLVEGVFA